MLLKRLTLKNYSAFNDATFDLMTAAEKPIVLFTGNNGAGKTSTLDAFRLALHGKRSFIDGISDIEYQQLIRGKFHNDNFSEPVKIALQFEYIENGENHCIDLTRSWRLRRKSIKESLDLTLDSHPLSSEIANDLLFKVVPPEVARYFFFDGEKIAELADWEGESDSVLFFAVNELLGLDLARQLERDLTYVTSRSASSGETPLRDLMDTLALLEKQLSIEKENIRTRRRELNAAVKRQEAARRRFTSLGGTFAEQRIRDEAEAAALEASIKGIEEAIRTEAAGLMPLLTAPVSLALLKTEVAKSEAVEVLLVIQHALTDSREAMHEKLSAVVGEKNVSAVLEAIREALLPKPIALDRAPLDMSLREATWMKNILVREIPSVQERLAVLKRDYNDLQRKLESRLSRLEIAPKNDAALKDAITALEKASAEVVRAQDALKVAEDSLASCRDGIAQREEEIRKIRHESFREARLALREGLINRLLLALPEFAHELRSSKEQRLGSLLLDFLSILWQKTGRLKSVSVDFGSQTIDLFDAKGLIQKRDLSAAEKQLFAIAFIFSLAKLSNRHLPFVIDTPLARLDSHHRQRLLTRFLPQSTHQVILFCTDTELLGSIQKETFKFTARHYELANFNGGVTEPVQVALAL